MKVLQINTTVNSGSTGRIAEDLGRLLLSKGHQSYIAHSRENRDSQSHKFYIGSKLDFYSHVLQSRILDNHGFASANATKSFVKEIGSYDFDIIHLHNIHGYYLNVEHLFSDLQKRNVPVFWTFHDCWPFTGHCAYFERVSCEKWKTECHTCPLKSAYPTSNFLDRSRTNFQKKKKIFNSVPKLNIVVPSAWLGDYVKQSFLGNFPVHVIHNGIDTETFKPQQNDALKLKYNLGEKKIVLGVASIWDKRKGLEDFVELSKNLDSDYQIVLVGLTEKQVQSLPENIIGITRTENVQEMANLYSMATVFANPTYIDNFPTTNIESLACGTPVVTYRTGGSPEALSKETGRVVDKGSITQLQSAIEELSSISGTSLSQLCRKRAVKNFNKNVQFDKYIDLYMKT